MGQHTVYLDDDLWDKLKELADNEGRRRAWLINFILRTYVDEEFEPPRKENPEVIAAMHALVEAGKSAPTLAAPSVKSEDMEGETSSREDPSAQGTTAEEPQVIDNEAERKPPEGG
jgi:predicted transcriptional regulator